MFPTGSTHNLRKLHFGECFFSSVCEATFCPGTGFIQFLIARVKPQLDIVVRPLMTMIMMMVEAKVMCIGMALHRRLKGQSFIG